MLLSVLIPHCRPGYCHSFGPCPSLQSIPSPFPPDSTSESRLPIKSVESIRLSAKNQWWCDDGDPRPTQNWTTGLGQDRDDGTAGRTTKFTTDWEFSDARVPARELGGSPYNNVGETPHVRVEYSRTYQDVRTHRALLSLPPAPTTRGIRHGFINRTTWLLVVRGASASTSARVIKRI